MQFRASVAVASIFLGGLALAHAEGVTQSLQGGVPFGVAAGGEGTLRTAATQRSFLQSQPNLAGDLQAIAATGRQLFQQGWTPALSFNNGDGLGPLFNAASCESCHRNGGRGPIHTVLLRLSVPPQTNVEQVALDTRQVKEIGDPTYGVQLQERGVPGAVREGSPRIEVRDVAFTLGDGSTVTMHEPKYSANMLNYGPMHSDVMMSARIAPPMIGLGLLEAVAPEDIVALADPNDGNGDGISGRPSYVLDAATGQTMLGRFGWKAGNGTLRTQSAAAFANDIGISTSVLPIPHGDCTRKQSVCVGMPVGGSEGFGVEATDEIFNRLVLFASTVAVPARRNADDPKVMAGQAAFVGAGCNGCHTPSMVTSASAAEPSQRSQRIWPYTDLLLHDMGPGLADNRPEGDATGVEWRTPPLWGIGLADMMVNGSARYLHDGRAQSLSEAILWHGGEALAARNAFAALSAKDRDALLAFLGSL